MVKEPEKNNEQTISLTPEQNKQFQAAVKVGIYKELHRKGLLTDMQLRQLISMQPK